MTIGEFLHLYERNHVAFLKTSVISSRHLQRYVGRLAHVELGALKRIQVMEWFHDIGKTVGPNAANFALQQLHSVYVKAEEWDVYEGKNPADHIKKFPKKSRERFIQSHEMPWLLRSIEEELPRTAVFFLALLLTGSRRDEARLMKWEHLNMEKALWFKPVTKTGVSHTIPLPAQLLERLKALPRTNEWVFPSVPNNRNGNQSGAWSRTAVEHHWRRIRERAGIKDLRIHDLRRTTASWLAIEGANLPTIQRVLNHASLQSTQVYARLSIEPVREALNEQAHRMLNGNSAKETVAMVAPTAPLANDTAEEWPG